MNGYPATIAIRSLMRQPLAHSGAHPAADPARTPVRVSLAIVTLVAAFLVIACAGIALTAFSGDGDPTPRAVCARTQAPGLRCR